MRIFISHSHEDKHLVEPIAIELGKVLGIDSVFYDRWSAQPSQGLIDKINKGLTEADIFFYFASKNSLESKMVQME